MAEKEKAVPKVLVVSKLPVSEYRELQDDKGETYQCVTTDEALTEILESVRVIRKELTNR